MPIFTNAYLQRLIEEAEEQISLEIPCIFLRFSISVTAGISTYTINGNLIKIDEILYKGRTIENQEFADYRLDPWMKPQNAGPQGLPMFYQRVGNGFNKIMFYPVPAETISANDSIIDTDTGINNLVIIEGRFAAEQSSDKHLPSYMFRNIMKFYAMQAAYAKEGPQQNLQASEFFGKLYKQFLDSYIKIINKVPQAVTLQFGQSADHRTAFQKPPRPVLPSTGKWSF